MAKKRMFTNDILSSDAFVDLPLSAQALYIHLCMKADDDGFCDKPKQIMRIIGATLGDIQLLIQKRFILTFENSSVVVIKHWKMHNTIQKDRYLPTNYQRQYALLKINKNKSYTLVLNNNTNNKKCIHNVSKMDTDCFQNGNTDIDLDIDLDIDKNKDYKDIKDINTTEVVVVSQKNNNNDKIIEAKEKRIKLEKRLTRDKTALTKELIKRKFINSDDDFAIMQLDELYYQIDLNRLFPISYKQFIIVVHNILKTYDPEKVDNKIAWFKVSLINNLEKLKERGKKK